MIIINRPKNGYETVSNIKVVFTDRLQQLDVANKVAYVKNYTACILHTCTAKNNVISPNFLVWKFCGMV